MAAHPNVVDTAVDSTLTAFVGIHRYELNQILTGAMVRPRNVMAERADRSWVMLDKTVAEAAWRALRWGFEELGYEQDERQLVLIEFEFTTLGVGHFMFTNQLTTTHDWQHFRFHGNLPLRCTNDEGELLVQGRVRDNAPALPPPVPPMVVP